mgnify:CR=1 FL=1
MTAHAVPRNVPTHQELVDEKLVVWYFYAALLFMTISMLAGILVALQLVHWNPLNGGTTFPRPLADDPYQCDCVWLFGECVPGNAPLGRTPSDVP